VIALIFDPDTPGGFNWSMEFRIFPNSSPAASAILAVEICFFIVYFRKIVFDNVKIRQGKKNEADSNRRKSLTVFINLDDGRSKITPVSLLGLPYYQNTDRTKDHFLFLY